MKIAKIARISLANPIPVYDLSVPGTENFALKAGIFVHNSKDLSDSACGAIYSASQSRRVRKETLVQGLKDRTTRRAGANRRTASSRRK